MNKNDLEELKRLAQAATPGPWSATHWNSHASTTVMLSGTTSVIAETAGFGRHAIECATDARFIAAANPAVVLELIAIAERAASNPASPALHDQVMQKLAEVNPGQNPDCIHLSAKGRAKAAEIAQRLGIEAGIPASPAPVAASLHELAEQHCNEWSESGDDRTYVFDDVRLEAFAAALATAPQAQAEQQPVAYADPAAFENFKRGIDDHEWMWAKPDRGLVPMFAAPVVAAAPVPADLEYLLEYIPSAAARAEARRKIAALTTAPAAPVVRQNDSPVATSEQHKMTDEDRALLLNLADKLGDYCPKWVRPEEQDALRRAIGDFMPSNWLDHHATSPAAGAADAEG